MCFRGLFSDQRYNYFHIWNISLKINWVSPAHSLLSGQCPVFFRVAAIPKTALYGYGGVLPRCMGLFFQPAIVINSAVAQPVVNGAVKKR